jgi:hypothetical protein
LINKSKGTTNLAPSGGQGKLTPSRGYPRPGPLGQDIYSGLDQIARGHRPEVRILRGKFNGIDKVAYAKNVGTNFYKV